MATYFTHDFTATDNDPWPNFTRVVGASLLAPVISNVGENGASAAERFYQSDFFPTTRDYKWDLDVVFANAVTSGRYFGMAARLVDDGDECYWVQISSYRMSDNTLNMPHIRIYRRRGGTDVEVVTEQDISATISGADLNAGVTFQLRIENTDESTVQVKVIADDGGGEVTLYTYEDTSAGRIESGGTIGIITGSTSTTDDVTYDNALAKDFSDEATGGGAPATGLALVINGTHYDSDEVEALGIAGVTAKQSYAIAIEGTLRDINDFHNPVLKPGDDIAIRWNDEYYAAGVLRPVIQDGLIPEGNSYEIHGAKMLSRGVVVTHPTTNQGQIIFNGDPEDPEYDADLDGKSPGDILAWLYDNHTEGQDGLRAHKACPASGTVATIPAGLSGGPVIPGITVSGTFAEAVEFVLSYMPQYAWRIDPETRHHYFDDRDASSSYDVDAADEHTMVRLETRPELNRTAVLIRGGKPETEYETLKLSDGTLEGKWDSTGEGTWTHSKHKINRIEGTVANFGQYSSDVTYGDRIWVDPDQTGGKFSLDTDVPGGNWAGTFVTINMTTHGTKTFQVYANTSSRLILTSITWPDSGAQVPTIGDAINLFGNRRKQSTVEGDIDNGQNNSDHDTFKTYGKTGGGQLAEGECFTANLKIPVGTSEDQFQTIEVGGKIKGGNLELDSAATLPVGLVNYLPGRNGGCGAGESQGVGQGNLGDIEIEAPVRQTVVPQVRVPTTGFRGTAWTKESSKWNGAGEAGVGDPGVRQLLVIDDPNFQYQAQQQADYTALADALLKVFGTLAVAAQITRTDTIEEDWRGLNKKATISDTESGRTTGYETTPDLWVAEVDWDFETFQTSVRIGNMSSFGGVNIQAVRQKFAENQRIKQFRDFIKRQAEILNCLKEGVNSAKGAEQSASQQQCSSDIRRPGGGSVEDSLDHDIFSAAGIAGGSSPCGGGVCTLVTNKGDAISNAADAVAKNPALSQPTDRGTLAGAESWIEDVVSCNQTHINALWVDLHDFVTATEAAFSIAENCFIQKTANISALDARITCLIDYINNTLVPCLVATFAAVMPGSGVPFTCDAPDCPSITVAICGSLCECQVFFTPVTCNA